MITQEITYQIERSLGFTPTSDQHNAIETFASFMVHRDNRSAMVLTGSAGTGKTALACAIVKTLLHFKQKVILMAPTGRAAKILATNSEQTAFTIHRKIYRQKSFSGLNTSFNLNDNLHKDTLFIVDEASMISNETNTTSLFGSGCLLNDLISYVYNQNNCRLLLIGDSSQLPPIGETNSPALDIYTLESYHLYMFQATLNQVLRQKNKSGILHHATLIKEIIKEQCFGLPVPITLKGFNDVKIVTGEDLIEALISCYNNVGVDETMVITRSNARAKIYNEGIRNRVLEREEELCSGDIVMVVKNNYYWTEQQRAPFSFAANGDRAIIKKVKNKRDLYGLRFADVVLQMIDYDNYELNATVVLDCLYTDTPTLTKEQNEMLYNGVLADYEDVNLKNEKMKQVRADAHFNALQIKFAYAVTCHKAQGGQWHSVFIDQGYITDEMLTDDYYHWLYTAVTRAYGCLFLVNWKIEE